MAIAAQCIPDSGRDLALNLQLVMQQLLTFKPKLVSLGKASEPNGCFISLPWGRCVSLCCFDKDNHKKYPELDSNTISSL